jgi:hypothetical protein
LHAIVSLFFPPDTPSVRVLSVWSGTEACQSAIFNAADEGPASSKPFRTLAGATSINAMRPAGRPLPLNWKLVGTALNSERLAPVAVLPAKQLQRGIYMTLVVLNRRNLLAAGGSILATGVSGLLLPAQAQGLAPTPSMSGGANNYRKGAAIVARIGKGGFWMSGTVRRAGDGAPLAGQRIQIWAHTTEGQEHEPQSHGATLTDKNGAFRLEMPQIIPIFGQPHAHLAYDSGEFKSVFLRPVMRSAREKSLEAHFVLQPA